MNDIISKLGECVEFGKINLTSPYPPAMKGQPGADELTREALENGLSPQSILNEALIPAMNRVGNKFTEGKIFVPQMLLSAKAMNSAMKHLKPYFQNGEIKRKGVFVIGTVMGDLHDIGKNLVGIMLKGAGYEVMDLGVNCDIAKYEDAVGKGAQIIGCSSLLTTTMPYMKDVVEHFKGKGVKVIIGGAPVTQAYADEIGADGYSDDANGAVKLVDSLMAC